MCAVILFAISATSISASVIRVKSDSPTDGPGSTWSNAYHTVTAAISASSPGDGIWVARGTYIERVTLKSGTALYGGFAGTETQLSERPSFPRANPDQYQTTMDGSLAGNVVTVPTSAAAGTLVDGFNIINGIKGIYLNASSISTITNNTVSGSSTDGIYCKNSSASTNICSNTIVKNSNSGIWCDMSAPNIANNIISGNGFIGICCMYYPVIMTNNTITGNGKYGITCNNCSPSIKNNIVAFNGNGVYNNASSNSTVLNNNCIFNPGGLDYENLAPGSGDISEDPGLVSSRYGKLHIQPISPCVNTGLDSAVKIAKDIDNQTRVQGAHVDIGADESDGTVWTVPSVVIYVSPTGQDANDGLGWGSAKKTVQAGVDTAVKTGGEVWVAAGTCLEHVNLRQYVYIYGGFAGTEDSRDERSIIDNQTIIDGSGTGNGISVECGYRLSAIDGFTVTNSAAGLYCPYSSPSIEHNTITGNTQYGIYCYYYSSAYIANNVVTSSGKHGIYCSNYSYPKIANNIISDSTSSGIYCNISSSPTITNNTIVESGEYGIYLFSASNPYITNNIIAFNKNGIDRNGTGCVPVMNNNCFYNPLGDNYKTVTPGIGDINFDPGFVSQAFGRLHIQPTSPCVDSGLPYAVEDGWKDIDGQDRILGDNVDIGADESDGTVWPSLPLIMHVSLSGSDTNDGTSWTHSKRTVQAAIDIVSSAGGEVWVAGGAYTEHVILKKYVYVYGGFAGVESTRDERNWVANKSILDGSGTGNVVTGFRGFHVSSLNGFVVRNGSTGIYSAASMDIENNTIMGNILYGIDCESSSPVIANNMIGNEQYGIYSNTGSPSIINNTISGTSNYGIFTNSSTSAPAITNNIVAYNSNGIRNSSSTNEPVMKNNCVYNPGGVEYQALSAGSGDISVDPKFASVAYGRLHIQPDSPCINKGLNGAVQAGWRDIDGQNRIIGGAVDMGADESDSTLWTVQPIFIRVSPNGQDKNDGSSWALAKRTVQAGVDAASEAGGEVWVAAGTYSEHVVLRQFAYLYGGFAGNEAARVDRNWTVNRSILDGSGTSRVVDCGNGSRMMTLDGFTVRNGADGIVCYASSPSIVNNIISGNTSEGIMCASSLASPSIMYNNIVGNGSYGIYCATSSPLIANNLITGGKQYGLYLSTSTLSVINNTITANGDFGVYCNDSAVTLTNNIVAFNAKGIYKTGTSGVPVLKNNCVYNPAGKNYDGLSAGTGDISKDPLFVSTIYGKLHIQPGSPCVNTGLSTAVQADWKDIDGQARLQGTKVDIGADESDGTVWTVVPLVVRVSPNGKDDNDGSSWFLAKKTVQAGINAAAEVGGEVWVAGGSYSGTVVLRPYTYIYGGFSGWETTRDQRNWANNISILNASYNTYVVDAGAGFHISGVDGFTMKNGYIGVSCSSSSPSIMNNTIKGMLYYGILCSYSSSPVIADNLVTDGYYYGIYCYTSSSPSITNNTVAKNNDYGIYCAASSPKIANNIIAFNLNGIFNDTGTPVLKTNCVYNPSGTNYKGLSAGTTDISSDPIFVNKDTGDYHIKVTSLCLNRGNDTYVGSGWADMDCDLRIEGTHVDIGADEYTYQKKCTLSATVILGNYIGIMEGVPVQIELRIAGVTKRIDNTTLDENGKFHLRNVAAGTYDVGIKPSHWLRHVVTGVVVGTSDLDFVIR